LRHADADSAGASSRLFLGRDDCSYGVGGPIQLHRAVRSQGVLGRFETDPGTGRRML
jgi:hypothetical protein